MTTTTRLETWGPSTGPTFTPFELRDTLSNIEGNTVMPEGVTPTFTVNGSGCWQLTVDQTVNDDGSTSVNINLSTLDVASGN